MKLTKENENNLENKYKILHMSTTTKWKQYQKLMTQI